MNKTLIKCATMVNEGEIKVADVLLNGEKIEEIENFIARPIGNIKIVDAVGLHLLPGMIDDQVHFHDPRFTHKGNISSESKAAIEGGITSYTDMPNTYPNSTTLQLLKEKYQIAANSSLGNYSFFMGINKNNLEESLKINNKIICCLSDDGLYFENQNGIIANNPDYSEIIFSNSDSFIALHCENDSIIDKCLQQFKSKYENEIPVSCHDIIREEDGCFTATKRVIEIAEKHNTRIHVLYVTTLKETTLFNSQIPVLQKIITAEACLQHLWFSNTDYKEKGSLIKWNPSVKSETNKKGLLQALKDNKLDIIATDHTPHKIEEKLGNYFQSKSGGPSVQHALPILFKLYHQNKFSLQEIVKRTSHNVAEIYRIKDRGYYADLVLVDINKQCTASQDSIFYKCGWSHFTDSQFKYEVVGTFVNGNHVFERKI